MQQNDKTILQGIFNRGSMRSSPLHLPHSLKCGCEHLRNHFIEDNLTE